jgi:large repetitive protein
LPISINVNQAGEGKVRFKVVDTYTNTLDGNGLLIEGLGNASVTLRSETNPNQTATGLTNALGELLLGPLPPGRYVYQVQAASHEPATGRVLLRASATVPERVFLDYRAVSFTWSVTPTTIIDQYHVNLTAVFQTLVPAPVLIIQPASINIEDLAVGEFTTGELAITNYGLLRADNVNTIFPLSDAYFRFEFFGEMPNSLAPNERVVLYYRITKLTALPGDEGRSFDRLGFRNWLVPQTRNQIAPRAGTCGLYQRTVSTNAQYVCAAGDLRPLSASALISRAFGGGCTPETPPTVVGTVGTGSGSGVGGWAGGYSGSSVGSTSKCGPDCDLGCSCTNGCNKPPEQYDDDGSDKDRNRDEDRYPKNYCRK